MTKVKERVAYLQGFTKGLNVNDKTPEGKAILNIIDVLEDIAEEVKDMHMQQQELETYVETLDEDLNDLEEEFYEEFAECGAEDFVELQCPVCHEEISFESELLHDADDIEVSCPHCGSIVYDNFGAHESCRSRHHSEADASYGEHQGA